MIRRDKIRGTFWGSMEDACRETGSFAVDLFDRYGRLRKDLQEHPIRKGTGVWGPGLDQDDLLLFSELAVKAPWRRQQIGSNMVGAILNEARLKTRSFVAFVSPYVSPDDVVVGKEEERSRIEAEALRAAERFWRSLGFRRVGISSWLAFTDYTNYASRELAASDDCDAPEVTGDFTKFTNNMAAAINSFMNPVVPGSKRHRQIHVEKMAQRWPLIPDSTGNTILHSAVNGARPDAIARILPICPELADVRNALGYTPLEWALFRLETERTLEFAGPFTIHTSDFFEGFGQKDIACLAALKQVKVSDVSKMTEEDIAGVWATGGAADKSPKAETIRATFRIKYGCTCGQCIGGFLSPRMVLALRSAAEAIHVQLTAEINAGTWKVLSGDAMRHLPRSARKAMKESASMKRGFINMYDHFVWCLNGKQLPTERNVLALYNRGLRESPPETETYLQRGGTVAAVGTSVFEAAMAWDDAAGNGTHYEYHAREVFQSAECRNDEEFSFVSGMCGYPRQYYLRRGMWA